MTGYNNVRLDMLLAPVFLCPVSPVPPACLLLLTSLTELITNLSLGIICTSFIGFCHMASHGNWCKARKGKIRYKPGAGMVMLGISIDLVLAPVRQT